MRKNRILFVDTMYPAFLESFRSKNADLENASHDDYLSRLLDSRFGDSDYYTEGMRRAGWDALQFVVNCPDLQARWARERGSNSREEDLIVEQIADYGPDVVYFQDLSVATRSLLERVGKIAGLCIGQIASPVPAVAHLAGLHGIFTSFPHWVDRFRCGGLKSWYMPLAFDPRNLECIPAERDVEVSFVGGLTPEHSRRASSLEEIAGRVHVDFWGYGAERLPEGSAIRRNWRGEAWGREMFAVLGRSSITLNQHIDCAEEWANNMRLFEATGCGALLLTDEKANLGELFVPGVEIETWTSPGEAVEKIRYYREHPDLARRIAQAGQTRTLKDHGYGQRMERTAEILERMLLRSRDASNRKAPDFEKISGGYREIGVDEVDSSLTEAWKDPGIPSSQRDLVELELDQMYAGTPPMSFSSLARALEGVASDGMSVLEIGCASGYYHEVLPYLAKRNIRYCGADYSDAMIELARRCHPRGDFLVADGASLPFPDGHFDLAISAGVLLHVTNWEEHLAEAVRVARDWVVLARTPVRNRGRTLLQSKLAYGVRTVELRFEEADLLEKCSKLGLTLQRSVVLSHAPAEDEKSVTYVFSKVPVAQRDRAVTLGEDPARPRNRRTRSFCTYFDKNYLARALVLFDSLRENIDGPWRIFAVCLDGESRFVLDRLAIPNVVAVDLATIELGDRELAIAKGNRSAVEYYWTITPTAMLRLLDRVAPGEELVYLDADMRFHSSPEPLFAEFEGADALIHEHRYSASVRYMEKQNGRFNVGMVGIRNSLPGREILDWWRDRCNEWCYARSEDGKFGDQLYLDRWPELFAGVRILQHRGAAVAPWNCEGNVFAKAADGTLVVDGTPIVFVHFHSFQALEEGAMIALKTPIYSLPEEFVGLCYLPYAQELEEKLGIVAGLLGGDPVPGRNPQAILPDHTVLRRGNGGIWSAWKPGQPSARAGRDPDDASLTPQEDAALQLLATAIGHVDRGELDAARKLLDSDPVDGIESARIQKAAGNVLMRAGFHNDARMRLMRAVRLDPAKADIHADLGTAWMMLQRYKESAACFKEALLIDPGRAETWKGFGIALWRAGLGGDAIDSFERAHRLAPHDGETLGLLGTVLRRSGDLAHAIPHLQQAVRLRPDDRGMAQELESALAEHSKDSRAKGAASLHGISAIVYGRNDEYGWNLHKRAAISLNTLAEQLDPVRDEILFVDCNTPDDSPTFPEAIADTLSSRAKSLLRILRIRPEQYREFGRGVTRPLSEALCRNVALRRCAPGSRWILSTNSDVILVSRDGVPLSKRVASLPPGIYGLPRFDVPQSLWETMDRAKPDECVSSVRRWAEAFGLRTAACRPESFIRWESPGDFQLVPREDLVAIGGFDESMIDGPYHVDSNMARRMSLIHGDVATLEQWGELFHCDHSRHESPRLADTGGNDWSRNVLDVASPRIGDRQPGWGAPSAMVEEVRIDVGSGVVAALSSALASDPSRFLFYSQVPGGDPTEDIPLPRLLPFVADQIATLPKNCEIGVLEAAGDLAGAIAGLRRGLGSDAPVLVPAWRNAGPGVRSVSLDDISRRVRILFVDAGTRGGSVDRDALGSAFASFCASQMALPKESRARVVLLASHSNWLGRLGESWLHLHRAPTSTWVMHGSVRDREDIADADYEALEKRIARGGGGATIGSLSGASSLQEIASAIRGRIPIAMPAYNRDDYLRQVLDALRRCDNLDRFFIVTGEEPDCPGTRTLFDAVDWIPVVRTRNPQRLGCNANVVGTIDRAFELSETAVVLEDDIVPSQDFLSFVLWGLDRFRNDSGVFSVCGYQRLVQPPSPEIAPVVGGFDWFSPWGWATWRNRWEAFRRDVRIPSDSGASWDCFVVEWAAKRQGLREMRPLVGRVQNIGEEGTWVPSAQWQRDNQFTPHWMGNLGWRSVAIPEFRLQGDGEMPAQAVSERIGDVGRSSLSGVLATIAAGLRTGDRNGSRKESRIQSDSVAAAPNSSARILLDLRTLADPNSISRGIGHYSLHLARAILARGGHRFGVLWDDRAGLERRPDLGDTVFEWVAYSTYQPGSWDLVHVFDPMGNHPNYEDPFTLFSAEPRLSLTFYDLIPWHMYRETMGRYWEVYLTRLERMKASDATYMCISRYTGEDLVREIGIDAARTEVVMAGLNAHHESGRGESLDRSLIGKLGIDGPFCLYVGAVDPHKNLEGAMQAWIRARMSIPGLKLVVVGRRNGLVQEFEQQVKAKGFADGITFTGFLERDVLEALYRRSIATLFLSRFEGFGFPVLEAMAADCPVICSDATSIPEVAGDAAIVCGPEDHDAAATALVRLHRDADLRSSMIARGNRQAALFTWDKVAVAVCARWGRELGCPPRTTTDLRRIAPSYIEMSAPIYDPSGYAAEARPVLNHLIDVGMPVKAIAIGRTSTTFREGCPAPMREAISIASDRRSSDGLFVQVIWFPGYAFKRNPQAAWNVGRTMFETDSLPESWVDPCNSMDEIWVPTDFNLETFRKAGVTVPLLKVPGGVDTEAYRPGLEPLPLPGRGAGTTYLSVFEWTARKGFDVLLKGWARAFKPSDDVRLVLRAYPPNAIEGDPVAWVTQQIDKTLASVGSSRDRCAPILVIASQVPEADMPRLYAAADVYLAPSRGEGWGRPHMEAMSCGVPVVATRWSGNLEFQDDDNSWLIDVEKLVPVGKEMAFQFYHGQKWAEPSLDSFVELLARSWKDVEGRRAKAERARRDIVGRWDWSISARFVSERLAEILQGIPPGQSHLADPAWVRALRDPSSCDPGSAAESFNSAGEQDASEGDRSAHEEADGSLSIRWEGSQFVHHSLAHVNRQLCVGLAKRGHDLSIIPYEPDQFGPGMDPDLQILGQLTNAPLDAECQIHVRHQWPPNLVAPKEGRWVVVQPWEFGSPPRDWMPAFRERVDEIWAYTGYVRDMYVRAGVPEDRVHVVPLGVDCDNFRPGIAPLASLPPKRGLRFLYVGGSIARKGFDVLLDAWQKAFGPDDPVELLIKDMGGKTSYKGQTGERTVRQIQQSGRFATIHYVDDDLAPSDLPGLYASGDVLVHPYRGEGFGLPIAEAMACGLPVIVTDGGAADDFCGSDEAWKIPSRKVLLPGGKVDQMETVEPPWWLEPSEEALIAALREAATNEGMRREKGERARQRIAEDFTWAHSVERAEARLRALASRSVRRGNQPAPLDASLEGLRSQGSGATYAAAEAQLEDMSRCLLEIEALLGRQRFEEAEELTAKLVEEHSGRHMAWVTRAIVYRGMKKTGKALEALKKAAEVGGGPEVHYETMALLLQTGKEGPARVQWNILREQFPAWVERQRAAHREQGTPWLPDRLKPHSKAKPARTGRR